MSLQTWEETISAAVGSGTQVANTTTETILFPGFTIPGNYMYPGRCLHVRAFGGYGTTSTPTIIISARAGGVGGTVLAKSSTFTTTSGTGGGASMTSLWGVELYVQCRTNGASGTLMSNGEVMLYTASAGTAGTVTNYGQPIPLVSGSTGGTTPATATVDTTADQSFVLTVTWGTANAANSIQGHNLTIESMN